MSVVRRSASVDARQRFALAEGDEMSVVKPMGWRDEKGWQALSTSQSDLSRRSKNYSDPKDVNVADPVHMDLRPSLLSTDAPTPENFRGLYTLAGIILFVMNFRLVVENILQYGFLISPRHLLLSTDGLPCLLTSLVLPFCIFLVYFVELLSFNGYVSFKTAMWVHILTIFASVSIPVTVIHLTAAEIIPGMILLFLSLVVALKLWSYCHVRSIYRSSIKTAKSFPVRFGHLIWFIAAPTLCYQEVYPRSPRIRLRFILRRLLEIIFICALLFVLAHQYIIPTVRNSFVHMDNRNIPRIMERVLKLAIPNTLSWLLGFYLFFHSTLNLMAELLRFGDRLFYMDWWNAPSLGVYWRTWNLPVRHFMLRHVYAPSLRCGMSPRMAQFFVFFLSAFIHELLFSVPFHMLAVWTFLGMLIQVPLVIATGKVYKWTRNPVWGNVTFWLVFCIFGQPLLMILYGHAYVNRKHS